MRIFQRIPSLKSIETRGAASKLFLNRMLIAFAELSPISAASMIDIERCLKVSTIARRRARHLFTFCEIFKIAAPQRSIRRKSTKERRPCRRYPVYGFINFICTLRKIPIHSASIAVIGELRSRSFVSDFLMEPSRVRRFRDPREARRSACIRIFSRSLRACACVDF